ncbi:hypothetical protein LCGC14_1579520 [marine sediment metagenome]|uniref:Uncharacterized protein n=1 Tax=marine sediment metagenome TaxID=412755 RepID=A0A0F9IHB0_9ZZZZ
MRTLNKTDEAKRSVVANADNNTVVCIHTVKPDEKFQTRYELKWTLDFVDVDDAEMLELAGRTVLIKQQQVWRKMSAKDRINPEKVDNITYKVRDILDNTRAKQTPVQKASNAVKKMSAADRKELMAELKAIEKAEKDEQS